MERNVDIIEDVDGKKIVIINDIRFKGKRAVDWDDVEEYLKMYIGEFYQIAIGKEYSENRKEKHNQDAKYGWYSYESRFAVPVYNEDGEIIRYNVFKAIVLIRHASDHKMYLYDIKQIKKETSNLFQSENFTQ